ncbi:MAG: transposase [Planctomycetaceae bacterium]|nr:transposase [Planctomycetaceae bacterium]
MPNYRRYHVAGGTYFFTVKTERNAPLFRDAANVRLLGEVFREMKNHWPLTIDAMVLLPDHLHTIWSLPSGDAQYPTRWAWLKKEFTRRFLAHGGKEQARSRSRRRHRRRGVWQRRYWEHTIEEEQDFEAHFDYIHWNPVKHGYVKCPADWPYSSFHRWVRNSVYPPNWACSSVAPASVTKVLDGGE